MSKWVDQALLSLLLLGLAEKASREGPGDSWPRDPGSPYSLYVLLSSDVSCVLAGLLYALLLVFFSSFENV